MIVQDLGAGSYESTLQPNWQMLQQSGDGSWLPLAATLESSATLPFGIQANTVSRLEYRFLVGGEVVVLGHGTLELGIAVDEGSAGPSSATPACDDGISNGNESDVDCGGTCAACTGGSTCLADSDCSGGTCAFGICGTAVTAGPLLVDTKWTKAQSPYVLGGTLQVGATLTVEAGTRVLGRNNDLEVHGALSVEGTVADPVELDAVRIAPRCGAVEPVRVTIDHALFRGGGPYVAGGTRACSTLSLRDSLLIGTEYIFLWYPAAAAAVERNVFLQAGGVSTGTHFPITITDNYFFEQTTPYAVLNWYSSSEVDVQVHGNTFASSDRIALALEPGLGGTAMDGTNNFWGADDAARAPAMIFDQLDDLNTATVIPFEPFLSAPSADTPIPPPNTP